MSEKPSAWCELRMLLAERLVGLGLDLMPRSHPHTRIWAASLGQAAEQVAKEAVKEAA